MRPIPTKIKKQLLELPQVCARRGEHSCKGRITWEHAWVYSSRQINEVWAIIFLCEYHHLGAGLNKDLNRYLSLKQATPEDLSKYPKKNWGQELYFLTNKFNI